MPSNVQLYKREDWVDNPNCVMWCWDIILIKQQEQLVSTNETEFN